MEQKKELLHRWELINHWRSQTHRNKRLALLPKIGNWIASYFKGRFIKCTFPTYNPTGHLGIYKMPNNAPSEKDKNIRIGLVSDWGSNSPDSDRIGFLMGEFNDGFIANKAPKDDSLESTNPLRYESVADYTIHLGDVYYVGDKTEIEENFGNESSWHYGTKSSFALCGNHEMYSNGKGFYENLLSKMGTPELKQEAGFFCLENDYWRIIGLDTGYRSVGWPIIEWIFPPPANLHKKQVEWLHDVVKIGDPTDKRGIILLSHHQGISAFEKSFTKASKQIADMMSLDMVENRPVIWFWGHEHRWSVYDLNKVGEGIKAYGRCIGHGGMPAPIEDASEPKFKKKAEQTNLLYFDGKEMVKEEKWSLSKNGYARLYLDNQTLKIHHVMCEDATNEKGELGFQGKIVLTELWSVDIQTGLISLKELKTSGSDISTILPTRDFDISSTT
jgi:hypothetical protein